MPVQDPRSASPAFAPMVGPRTASFRDRSLVSDPLDPIPWGYIANRTVRYVVNWALYENSFWSPSHRWSPQAKASWEAYKWTRNVFNRAHQVGEFWAYHLMGGNPTDALPVTRAAPGVAEMVAQLWRDSNWAVRKSTFCRWGAVMGDAAIEVVDLPQKKRVILNPVSAANIIHLKEDIAGNVLEYTIEEQRPDPTMPEMYNPDGTYITATYTKEVYRDGDEVIFRTFRNGEPFDWNDALGYDSPGAEWSMPYGFVPLVRVQHIDVGMGWGWSEYHPAMAKTREMDDLGSCLTDQARKILNTIWFVNAAKPGESAQVKGKPGHNSTDEFGSDSNTSVVPSRDQTVIYWLGVDKQVNPKQLVGSMPIAEIGGHIDRIMGLLEEEYPELRLGDSTGVTGRARRIARQQAEAKVHARRPAYDDALVRANMMAMSIGGRYRGKGGGAYPGYESVGPNSYRDGDLFHEIGKRPVFATDPMDVIEEEQARSTVVLTLTQAGVPKSVSMERAGYTKDEIAKAVEKEQLEIQMTLMAAHARAEKDRMMASRQSGDGQPMPVNSENPRAAQGSRDQAANPGGRNLPGDTPTSPSLNLEARPPVPFETRQ